MEDLFFFTNVLLLVSAVSVGVGLFVGSIEKEKRPLLYFYVFGLTLYFVLLGSYISFLKEECVLEKTSIKKVSVEQAKEECR